MKGVAAGFGLGGDETGDCLAEFRVVVLRGYLHLRGCVQIGVDDGHPDDRVLVVGAVQLVAGGKGQLPVDLDLLAALGVVGFTDVPADVAGSGRQQFEGSEIAVEVGQIFDGARVQDGADFRPVGLQQWGARNSPSRCSLRRLQKVGGRLWAKCRRRRRRCRPCFC